MLGMLLIVGLLCVAGCGSDAKGSDAVNVQGSSVVADQNDTQKEAQADGYVFVYKKTTITVNGDMAPVAEALGEPTSYFEAASCAFDGLDKIYTYGPIVVETYPEGNKDLVSAIIVKDDSVTTPEKVTIGSSKQEMLDAYGKDYTEEAGMFVYKKGSMKLQFIVKDDVVTSIQYSSTAVFE